MDILHDESIPRKPSCESGDTVRTVMTDVADRRPVVDLLWFHEDYVSLFETWVAPGVIYVVRKKHQESGGS